MEDKILARGTNLFKAIVWAIVAVACVIGFILIANGSINMSFLYDHFVLKTVRTNNLVLSVRVAKTPAEQMQSLNDLKSLPENEGIIFIFDTDGRYSFSTAHTLFPVDVIWLDSDGTVVDAQANVAPGLRDPIETQALARYVLVVNAGVMDHNDITIHTPVDISDIK